MLFLTPCYHGMVRRDLCHLNHWALIFSLFPIITTSVSSLYVDVLLEGKDSQVEDLLFMQNFLASTMPSISS